MFEHSLSFAVFSSVSLVQTDGAGLQFFLSLPLCFGSCVWRHPGDLPVWNITCISSESPPYSPLLFLSLCMVLLLLVVLLLLSGTVRKGCYLRKQPEQRGERHANIHGLTNTTFVVLKSGMTRIQQNRNTNRRCWMAGGWSSI